MSLRTRAILFQLLLAAVSSSVRADPVSTAYSPVKTIDKPNGDQGWCYYCSDNDAPPLCNSQCTVAINRLCGEDIREAMTTTEQDCEIQYLPPAWEFDRNGARNPYPTESQCIEAFNGILSNCGKDASQPASGVNASYCTKSGGGGTFGWKDDGSPLRWQARYVIKTKGTDQCGQAQAPWQQATSVIEWDPNWIADTDQVVLVTDAAPSAATAAMSAMENFPTPNPECDSKVCNIYGEPYYAESPNRPWQFGRDRMLRHRVIFEGWDQAPGALNFFHALRDRCQEWPDNWQVYKNGSQSVADLGLPSWEKRAPRPGYFDPGNTSDLCWCIAFALYEASGGIEMPVKSFCLPETEFPSQEEFAPARKRDLEGPGLFKSVEKKIAKRAAMEEKKKRDLIQEISGVERDY